MNDFLLNGDGDLLIENGDFVMGAADLQHQRDILLAHKGEFKEHPELGVGLEEELLSENPAEVLNQIRRNFEHDGMMVRSVALADNGNLVIDASY